MGIIYISLSLCVCSALISISCCSEILDTHKILQTLEAQQHAISQLTNQVLQLKGELQSQKRQMDETSERLRECSRNKRMLLENPYEGALKVGFTAKLSKHMLNLGNNQAILFDYIVTNIGHHYSPNTGVFTAPINATYYFSASILSHTNELLQTEIVKNGIREVMIYSYDNDHEQGSNSVVLQLNIGDEVWVRHLGMVGTKVYGNGWSTFSGFKISDD
ncbi:complement C1q tumor necrosis factor-related protein 3-like [Ruditapes philippinarum]|uniref:complement C1q tumor necrosis factor-related protein 3-like n=1 Tax=Ruditapes philippinarum TaxID=129788 RepID=UPI00295BD79B|nr:complement C1q tumor necrosis factor-related protein 3-like [Ruditapes philippinarum]